MYVKNAKNTSLISCRKSIVAFCRQSECDKQQWVSRRKANYSHISQQLLVVHYLETKRFENMVRLSSDIFLIITQTKATNIATNFIKDLSSFPWKFSYGLCWCTSEEHSTNCYVNCWFVLVHDNDSVNSIYLMSIFTYQFKLFIKLHNHVTNLC